MYFTKTGNDSKCGETKEIQRTFVHRYWLYIGVDDISVLLIYRCWWFKRTFLT